MSRSPRAPRASPNLHGSRETFVPRAAPSPPEGGPANPSGGTAARTGRALAEGAVHADRATRSRVVRAPEPHGRVRRATMTRRTVVRCAFRRPSAPRRRTTCSSASARAARRHARRPAPAVPQRAGPHRRRTPAGRARQRHRDLLDPAELRAPHGSRRRPSLTRPRAVDPALRGPALTRAPRSPPTPTDPSAIARACRSDERTSR